MTDVRAHRIHELVGRTRQTSSPELRVAWFFGIVTIGFLAFHRSFAYVGIPPLGLYVGEIAFFVALVYPPTRRAFVEIVHWVTVPGPYHLLGWALLVQAAYGLFQVARGYQAGMAVLELWKFAVFNTYPFALMIGWWMATAIPDALRRFAIALAWSNAVLGVAFLLVLDRLGITIPGSSDVALNIGNGAAFAIIALVCFEPRLSARWYLFAANGIVLLGAQGRAQWIAIALSLFLWAWLTGRLRSIVAGVAGGVLALSALGLLGIDLPTASTRGGSTSLVGVVGRMIATFDPETAAGLVGDTSDGVAGSTRWRSQWWGQIWSGVHSSSDHALIGYGYASPLNQLVRYVGEDVRTPHNVALYALGYGGWVGLIVFALFHSVLAAALWRVWKRTGQPFGFLCWVVAVMIGLFSNWFEAPFGAFPTFVILGMALAPLAESRVRPVRHRLGAVR